MGHQDPGRQHRLDNGLCFRCGKAPHLAGRTRCDACAKKDSLRSRNERGKALGISSRPLTRAQREAAGIRATPPRKIPNRSKNMPFYHLAECVKPARVPVVVQKGGERSEAMPAPRKAEIPARHPGCVLW